MADPYTVLGVAPTDGDATVRERYLDAVRRFPPERFPAEFQRIRDAYERIKDADSRLAFLLFDATQGETIDELLAEEQCRTSLKRVGLSTLLSLIDQPH